MNAQDKQQQFRLNRAALLSNSRAPGAVFLTLASVAKLVATELRDNGAPEETWKPYLDVAEKVSKAVQSC